jgi:hypothetical protein
MKYTIRNIEFKNKTSIIAYCRELIARNQYKKLCGDDLDFMLELLSYHNDKSKLDNYKYIMVDDDKHHKNLCLWVYKETKSGLLVCDDISWTHSINNIPVNSPKNMDYVFKFGKYKGISIYDIQDRKYIEWVLVNVVNLNRGDKVLLNQYLKYGYIPFNPIFIKNAKKSKEKELK